MMTDNNKSLLERTIEESARITRYAVEGEAPDKSHPVLTTGREIVFVEKGVSVWKFDLNSADTLSPGTPDTPHARVDARWLNAQAALEQGIEVFHGGSANTFGSMGTLLVPPGFKVPGVIATPSNVRFYGLTLFETGSDFAVSSPKYQTVMMDYDYSPDYRDDFLMQKYGGGGIFVETHDFPHIHIPLSPDCHGYILIGKPLNDGAFCFTAFRIPYGMGLYTPAGTIHGDGTLVGHYGITVADGALAKADTVLVYNSDTLSMAEGVVPID
ncbi:MAG: hypothetical protein CMI01_12850 [Oceanospirillaceae bacterium]|nr:hypothetical protein [Oceanospirillaceae bacterium]